MSTTYSLKKDGKKKISANFMVSEFKCNDGSDTILIDPNLVTLLQKVRDHFNKPITINSAYRTPSYNKSIGGVSNSQHTLGTAADIVVANTTPLQVAQYVEYIMPSKGGIGLYSSFTHVDVRANRSRWENYGSERIVTGFPGYSEPKKPSVTELEKLSDNIWELEHRQILSNTTYWQELGEANVNIYWLLRKITYYVRKKEDSNSPTLNLAELTDINDILWELTHRQIISNDKLWKKEADKNSNIYWLLRKTVKYIRNKNF